MFFSDSSTVVVHRLIGFDGFRKRRARKRSKTHAKDNEKNVFYKF